VGTDLEQLTCRASACPEICRRRYVYRSTTSNRVKALLRVVGCLAVVSMTLNVGDARLVDRPCAVDISGLQL